MKARFGCVCGKVVAIDNHPGPRLGRLTEEERAAIRESMHRGHGWIVGRCRPFVCSQACYDARDPDMEPLPIELRPPPKAIHPWDEDQPAFDVPLDGLTISVRAPSFLQAAERAAYAVETLVRNTPPKGGA